MFNGAVKVVYSLKDSRAFHFHDCFADFLAVSTCKNKFSLASTFGFYFTIFVDVAVCMTANDNWLFPAGNASVKV